MKKNNLFNRPVKLTDRDRKVIINHLKDNPVPYSTKKADFSSSGYNNEYALKMI